MEIPIISQKLWGGRLITAPAAAAYTYDPYGKPITATGTLANVNPLRYRGYVYDPETGLYYLQSRYYNPELGRFISPDAFASTGQGILGNNMFAYCLNNPVSFIDESGCLPRDTYMVEISGQTKRIPPVVIPDNIYTKKDGLINGQAVCLYSNEAFGWGTYGKNGCGIIAIYNSMQLLGYSESLAAIDTEIFIEGGYAVGGLFGVFNWAIDNYYSRHNIPCKGYSSYSSMRADLSDGDVIVFLVWNNKNNIFEGQHYMAAQYCNNQFVVYNYSSFRTKSRPFMSLDQINNSCWIYGYIVGG